MMFLNMAPLNARMRQGQAAYYNDVLQFAPIAYWPFWEASGTTADDMSATGADGTYSNVTLGAAGIGDGKTAAQFVAASASYVDVDAAAFRNAFGHKEGSVSFWARVSGSGVWTDGATRYILHIEASSSHYLSIYKMTGANTLLIRYRANSTNADKSLTISTTAWFHIVVTWSDSGDTMRVYLNGTEQTPAIGSLGTWPDATPPIDGRCTIGAYYTPNQHWSGDLAHVAFYNKVLTEGEATALFLA